MIHLCVRQHLIVPHKRLATTSASVVQAEMAVEGNQVGYCKRMLTMRNGMKWRKGKM